MTMAEEVQNMKDYPRNYIWLFPLILMLGTLAIYVLSREDWVSLLETYMPISREFFLPILLSLLVAAYALTIYILIDPVRYPSIVDSLYYMGFIFTLATMIAAFTIFTNVINSSPLDENGNRDIPPNIINSLISQNGAALATTLVAIVSRIMIVLSCEIKSHPNKTDIFELTDVQINSYAQLFDSIKGIGLSTEEIVHIASEADDFKSRVDVVAAGTHKLETAVTSFALTIGDKANEIETLHDRMVQLLANLVANTENNLGRVTNKNGSITAEVNRILNEISDNLKKVSENVEQFDIVQSDILKLYVDLLEKLNDKDLES